MSPRAIITGASTGIGYALAHELARRGYELVLLARRVADVPNAIAISCDVTDANAVKDAVQKHGPFDLAIANAGVSIPIQAASFAMHDAEHVLRVNVLGLMYLYDAVIPSMIERRGGRFVGVASIAGLRGLPGAGPYSASKAAVQAFLEAARIELAPYGVGVTIVNPGFVATPMTEKNRFRMPFLMQPAEAAVVIADGIEHRKRVVEFPRPMSILMRLVRYLPDALYDRIMLPYARRKLDATKVKR
ncbi:MAG TPA: SDR family NAD(P)-dependent oxidoreductase [Thermoanaerobaculia bacterium]|nr:SDR family NAD(P)-dependent oxidoreductase [Thermoanaerobaculia bacterium]